MALLDALRALTALAPPPSLPDCDLAVLGDVLEAHGLAPMASYHLETTRLGSGVPESFRERLLSSYQGVVNDNVLKLVSLRNALKLAPDVPVVLLDAAAYVDWLYPHMAFRPVIDARKCTRCGQCVQACPVSPKAVDWHDGNRKRPPSYKYLRCIRCFCCQEICPEGAISVKSTILEL